MQRQLLNIKKIKVKSLLSICFITMLLLIIHGCEDFFEYSPYAANVKSEFKNSFDTNLFKILSADTIVKDEFKFAVIADSHYNYHELNEAVININSRNDIDFVIVNGDIADHGYNKEYELF